MTKSATVLITGGNGLVGNHLSGKLTEKGFKVVILSRTNYNEPGRTYCLWDPRRNEIDMKALSEADYIIHLAGANIGEKRWTKRRKKELEDSRVKTAGLILEKIKESNRKPKAFISASGTGYYGAVTSEKIYHEDDISGGDFTGELCRKWEEAAGRFEETGIRTVIIRTGIVLSEKGGALGRMALPARIGLASALGKGSQYMPWIHISDLCAIYLKAIEDEAMRGPYNAAAPEQCTNKQFVRGLAKALGRPFRRLNVPSLVMKILFGEMSEILLEGSRVSSEKISKTGYRFRFPSLEDAFADLLPGAGS